MADIPTWIISATGFVTPASALIVWWIFHKTLFSTKLDAPASEKKKISFSVLAVLILWLAAANLLGSAEIFRAHSYLVPVVAFGIPYFAMKFISGSQIFSKVIDSLPNHWIIGIQLYRLLGIIFISLWLAGSMPAEFAIPAGVGDMIVGLSAPVVAYFILKKFQFAKKIAVLWNYVGIADLIIAMIMGPLTAPTLVQMLSFDAPNELIISYPLVTIPTFAVPFAFLLHLISLRILKSKNKK